MRQFMRLEWSVLAQTDRDAIFDYIEADSHRPPSSWITASGCRSRA
jgi:plasmid stabilization system protein ParE